MRTSAIFVSRENLGLDFSSDGFIGVPTKEGKKDDRKKGKADY